MCCLTGMQGMECEHTHASVGIILVISHLHVIFERMYFILGCRLLQQQRHCAPVCKV